MPTSNNMKKKNPVYKIISSTLGIILLAILITTIIIIPSINYIKNIKQDIQTIEKESANQYDKIRLLKKSIAELDTINKNTTALEQSLINKDDAINLIKEFEDMATAQHIEQNLTIASGQNDSILFTFKTKASFYSTLQYLNSLEHLPFYITMDNLNWTKVDATNVSLSFEATIFTK